MSVGPHPELLGRRLSELKREPRQLLSDDGFSLHSIRVGIQQREDLERVEPASGFVPAYLTGRIGAETDGNRPSLAIAVNGVIRATTRSYAGEDSLTGFAVLVPESAYRTGANDVAVYEVRRTDARR